jgi:NAD(P)-dependent dehydrogenase (short-subunit alcohol dehydrogenase family)
MGATTTLEPEGSHRYGIVLALALAAVTFLILSPESDWSRAASVVFAGLMLVTVVVTSRGDRRLHHKESLGLIVLTAAIAASLAIDWAPHWVGSVTSVALVLATLVQLVRGMARLLQGQGVTVQAVAGALAIYLLLGILFAFAVTAMAKIGSEHYFAQGTDGTESQRVYFSFTSMTTTGFGDLTPATRGGRALAVLEMLLGQIYLVTVISLLVGNLRRRRAPGLADDAA